MQEDQRRIIGRVLDEIRNYRDGRQTMLRLLNNSWGLFEAAEVRDPDERGRFMEVYFALSGADDANQPSMPLGLGSDQEVLSALVEFENYARAVRDQGSDGDHEPGDSRAR